jgi:hypothetical protein
MIYAMIYVMIHAVIHAMIHAVMTHAIIHAIMIHGVIINDLYKSEPRKDKLLQNEVAVENKGCIKKSSAVRSAYTAFLFGS